MKLSERVAAIEKEIENCNNTAKAIVITTNVKLAEQLTGVNKEAWDTQHALHLQLTRWLNLAEGYIINAENLIKTQPSPY